MHKHLMTIFTTTVSTFLTVSCSTSAQNMDHNRTDSQHAASLANASPSNLTSSNTPPSVTGPAAAKSIGSEVGTGTEASTPLLIAGHNYSKVTPPSTQQGDGLSNLAASPPLVGGGNTPATLNTDSTVSGLDPNLATTPLLIGVGPTGTRNPSRLRCPGPRRAAPAHRNQPRADICRFLGYRWSFSRCCAGMRSVTSSNKFFFKNHMPGFLEYRHRA